MKKYIGKKSIMASPMSKSNAESVLNRSLSGAKGGEDGYLVEYEDGYWSWLPKETFESAYKIAETHLDRLLIESEEFKQRKSKLRAFILSEEWSHKLDNETRNLLLRQYSVMSEYSMLLIERIQLEAQHSAATRRIHQDVEDVLRKLFCNAGISVSTELPSK